MKLDPTGRLLINLFNILFCLIVFKVSIRVQTGADSVKRTPTNFGLRAIVAFSSLRSARELKLIT